jgi:hypothetical protein
MRLQSDRLKQEMFVTVLCGLVCRKEMPVHKMQYVVVMHLKN